MTTELDKELLLRAYRVMRRIREANNPRWAANSRVLRTSMVSGPSMSSERQTLSAAVNSISRSPSKAMGPYSASIEICWPNGKGRTEPIGIFRINPGAIGADNQETGFL
jgi:hypothetical protein